MGKRIQTNAAGQKSSFFFLFHTFSLGCVMLVAANVACSGASNSYRSVVSSLLSKYNSNIISSSRCTNWHKLPKLIPKNKNVLFFVNWPFKIRFFFFFSSPDFLWFIAISTSFSCVPPVRGWTSRGQQCDVMFLTRLCFIRIQHLKIFVTHLFSECAQLLTGFLLILCSGL